MAGGGSDEDNPVAVNVVPLIDVIFCLCVFFMCSFRFKQLEGKFESWLPKDKGMGGEAITSAVIQEVRVAMFWDATREETIRQLGSRRVKDDEELQRLIREAHEDFVKLNKPEAPVIIDADARVPWKDVVAVMNLCKREKIDNIEFAMGVGQDGK